jgi:hypothetical protein
MLTIYGDLTPLGIRFYIHGLKYTAKPAEEISFSGGFKLIYVCFGVGCVVGRVDNWSGADDVPALQPQKKLPYQQAVSGPNSLLNKY